VRGARGQAWAKAIFAGGARGQAWADLFFLSIFQNRSKPFQRSPEGARKHYHPETTGLDFVVVGDIRAKRWGNSVGLPRIQTESGGIPREFRTYGQKAGKFREASPHTGAKRGTPSTLSKPVVSGW
jgi:hypothetical protein